MTTEADWERIAASIIGGLMADSINSPVYDSLEEFCADATRSEAVASFADGLLVRHGAPTCEAEITAATFLAYEFELRGYGCLPSGTLRIGVNLDVAALLCGWMVKRCRLYRNALAAVLEGDSDPASLCLFMGGKAYEKFVDDNQKDWMTWLIEEGMRHGFSLDDPLGRLEVAKAVAYRIACVNDDMLRSMECARLASKVRVPQGTVTSMVDKYRRERRNEPEPQKRKWRS